MTIETHAGRPATVSAPPSTGYRLVVVAAWASLALIVLTGAAVRLTEAGLGCENWPACSDDRVVPEWSFHPWVEFGNRLLSFVVTAAVAAAVIGAYRQRPRRDDLIAWSSGLVAGVVAQILLGGVTVILDLHPAVVGLHFLLSMVLLWNVAVLWVRANPSPPRTGPPDGGVVGHGWLAVALAAIVLLTGTLVTGTGPNGGDSRAARLGFDLVSVVRIHSITVWLFLAALVLLAIRLHRRRGADAASAAELRIVRWLVGVAVAQGGIGYLQFALGVPPALVALHIAGAVVVWSLTVLLALRLAETGAIAGAPAPSGLESPADLDRMST